MRSLWGPTFNPIEQPKRTKKVLDKINNPKKIKTVEKTIKSKTTSIEDKLKLIEENVHKILGIYEQNTVTITDINIFHQYISQAINNGVIAVDTETNNSLDPLTCKIMGLCIYTPGQKNAYIPVNHINRITNEKLNNQITEEQIKIELDRLCDTKIIMHNGKFDYEVIKCTCDCELNIYWDTMIGARLLNENERAGLKEQYISKIDSSIQKYSIEHLFEKLQYEIFDPQLFALYAATDAYMTYELYKWQAEQFNLEDNNKLKSLFFDVEMPIVTISAKMELLGIELDLNYANKLSQKYHHMLEDVQNRLKLELDKYASQIASWRLTSEAQYHPIGEDNKVKKSKSEQLDDPIKLSSPTQLSIFLYDILKIEPVDIKNPRGTGIDIIKQIDLDICKLIIEERSILKMLNAFIEALPKLISEKDGRLHSHFNQLGTDTGRFSSTSPNLQQIPSSNKEIRMMFKAKDGYTLVGADYSQQEPRLLTAYSMDENLLDAYNQGKDMYATIGVGVYKNNYWDNMEHFEDGRPNVEGKKRRSKMKGLLLGMMYGMGPKLLGEIMNCTKDEAVKIIDDFYTGFPKVQSWISETEKHAQIVGYTEDFWGRRRRLPDLLLDDYTVDTSSVKFNPLLNSSSIILEDQKKIKYIQRLKNSKSFTETKQILSEAKSNGVTIKDNTYFKSKSLRQCVNARIQGGAATMTKKAMISIDRDPIINSLGFRLLIGVHDELIGECPVENAEKVADRLTYLMRNAVPELTVPFKCDAEIEDHWYKNEMINIINKEYSELKADDKLDFIYHKYSQFDKQSLNKFLNIN